MAIPHTRTHLLYNLSRIILYDAPISRTDEDLVQAERLVYQPRGGHRSQSYSTR